VNLRIINPLSNTAWDELVACHPRASAFHQPGWLKALSRTYGYEPLVLTSTAAGRPLSDGIVLCRVSSWITGTRLVSLPFTDHCEPLLDDLGDSFEFIDWLRTECNRQRWKYIELRPLSSSEGLGYDWPRGRSYYFHRLDLAPTLEQIFRGFHRDSIQRRIRRAEGEQLSYEVGRSEELVDAFYRLLLRTRRRHQMLPQPRTWFKNLVRYLGDKVQVRLARKNGLPIAALLTLQHRSSVVYKYGCSDERFHHLAGMPFLFWRLIEESKAAAAAEIDFGRSDMDNKGLVMFKDRFGTTKKLLTYYRYPQTEEKNATTWVLQPFRQILSILPDAVLPTASGILYKHMG
jgi:hypothetical protein